MKRRAPSCRKFFYQDRRFSSLSVASTRTRHVSSAQPSIFPKSSTRSLAGACILTAAGLFTVHADTDESSEPNDANSEVDVVSKYIAEAETLVARQSAILKEIESVLPTVLRIHNDWPRLTKCVTELSEKCAKVRELEAKAPGSTERLKPWYTRGYLSFLMGNSLELSATSSAGFLATDQMDLPSSILAGAVLFSAQLIFAMATGYVYGQAPPFQMIQILQPWQTFLTDKVDQLDNAVAEEASKEETTIINRIKTGMPPLETLLGVTSFIYNESIATTLTEQEAKALQQFRELTDEYKSNAQALASLLDGSVPADNVTIIALTEEDRAKIYSATEEKASHILQQQRRFIEQWSKPIFRYIFCSTAGGVVYSTSLVASYDLSARIQESQNRRDTSIFHPSLFLCGAIFGVGFGAILGVASSIITDPQVSVVMTLLSSMGLSWGLAKLNSLFWCTTTTTEQGLNFATKNIQDAQAIISLAQNRYMTEDKKESQIQ